MRGESEERYPLTAYISVPLGDKQHLGNHSSFPNGV